MTLETMSGENSLIFNAKCELIAGMDSVTKGLITESMQFVGCNLGLAPMAFTSSYHRALNV